MSNNSTYQDAAQHGEFPLVGRRLREIQRVVASAGGAGGNHKMTIEAQGHLFKVKVHLDLQNPAVGCPGSRDKIKGFSAASRKRLLEKMARLEPGPSLFLTLTYPEPLPAPTRCKRDLDVFLKRLKRQFPAAAVIWRFEHASKGQRIYHPHFHLIVFNVPWLAQSWLHSTWRAVIGASEGAWVWVEKLHNWKKAFAYVAKYVAKAADTALSLDYIAYLTGEEWIGRAWGVMNSEGLPWAAVLSLTVPFEKWFFALRRAAARRWRGVQRLNFNGFSLFVDDAGQWVDLAVCFSLA